MNVLLRPALLLVGCLLWTGSQIAFAQSPEIDSLKRQLAQQPTDTTRVRMLGYLSRLYLDYKPDTAYRLAQQAYRLAQQLDDKPGQARGLNMMGCSLANLGDSPKSIRLFQQAIQISRSLNDSTALQKVLNNMTLPYQDRKDYKRALQLLQESYRIFKQVHRNDTQKNALEYGTIMVNLGEAFVFVNRLDSASYYLNQALFFSKQEAGQAVLDHVLYNLGNLEFRRRNPAAALAFYRQGLTAAQQNNNTVVISEIYLHMAMLYQATGPIDSSLVNARRALAAGQQSGYLRNILSSSELLTQLYEGRDNTQALRYYKVAVAAKDSLFSQEKLKQLLTLGFEEQQRQQDLAAAEEAYQNRIRTYGLSGLVAVVLLVAGLLWRTNRRQQRSNQLLGQQKEEINQQRSKAEQALRELQTTQDQLIQQEKMASLGVLTAGIAHEIQNPLNFVNNFAEVSAELVEEFREESMPHLPSAHKAQAEELLDDLHQNLRKITHHGRRADAIVKGMLAHSRSTSGTKELTDINALANEYLQLAYHGVRAKEKGDSAARFNVNLVTDFDERIGRVAVVPQDIGRVLLNLYNNALYAVQEKKRNLPESEEYRPTIWVRTQLEADQIRIEVRDNGTGMPESVQQKIFQPFFSTKPTGEGTGLGLSLSYDMVTKGHGGTLSVVSEPGQFTQMQIILPLSGIS